MEKNINFMELPFEIAAEIKGSNLYCSVSNPIKTSSDVAFQYAFYLMHNGVRINTRWYTSSPSTEFLLKESGRYHIVAFICWKEEKRLMESKVCRYTLAETEDTEPIQQSAISIFGSCVSRDVLEFQADKSLELKSYIARQSVISSVCPSIQFQPDDIKLTSNFQKQQVLCDLSKSAFLKLESDGSRYLLLDLVDERFSLARLQDSYITYSNELAASGFLESPVLTPKEKRRNAYYIQEVLIDSYIDVFCEKIERIYPQAHIIFHEIYFSDRYLNRSGYETRFSQSIVNNNTYMNQLLAYIANQLKSHWPNMKIIDISRSYLADENHKWGLSPMHFEEEYYQAVLKKLYHYSKQSE